MCPGPGGEPGAAGAATAAVGEVALTGGLFKLGEPLLVPLAEELAAQLPHARRVAAAGDPLSGAVALAAALAGRIALAGRTTAIILSGGNVDPATFITALSR